MNTIGITIAIFGCLILLIIIIIYQYLRCRIAEKEKSRAVFFHIKEQTRLARELENATIENQTLEKILKSLTNDCHSVLNSNKDQLQSPEKNH